MGSKQREKSVLAWHFAPDDRSLRYGDGRKIKRGAVFEVERGKVELCCYGLHASMKPLDALRHAPGSIISRVRSFDPIYGGDKIVGYKRKHIWVADAESVLYKYSRLCALGVFESIETTPGNLEAIRLWLVTGDEKYRSAAESAAKSAESAAWSAESAAWYAARSAAYSAAESAWYAAWYASRYAAEYAAESAEYAAARHAEYAAWYAARYAAVEKQNRRLHRMLMSLKGSEYEIR